MEIPIEETPDSFISQIAMVFDLSKKSQNKTFQLPMFGEKGQSVFAVTQVKISQKAGEDNPFWVGCGRWSLASSLSSIKLTRKKTFVGHDLETKGGHSSVLLDGECMSTSTPSATTIDYDKGEVLEAAVKRLHTSREFIIDTSENRDTSFAMTRDDFKLTLHMQSVQVREPGELDIMKLPDHSLHSLKLLFDIEIKGFVLKSLI